MPFIYDAAGLARKAIAAPSSEASAILPAGMSLTISFSISASDFFSFSDLLLRNDSKRLVSVYPGKTLFTVIPKGPNSVAMVFAQLATAPLIVLETPRPFRGVFTDVEITFMILP